MADQSGGPYVALSDAVQQRKEQYLRMLAADLITGKEEEVVGKRRGFFKGRGPRLQCSLLEQDLALRAVGDYLAAWTDNPCARAAVPERWDVEDVNVTIARLWLLPSKDTRVVAARTAVSAALHRSLDKSFVILQPPDQTSTAVRFRSLMLLVRQLGITDRNGFRVKMRHFLGGARDQAIGAPDFNASPVFDAQLIERIVASLDSSSDPDADDRPQSAQLASTLATLKVEGRSDYIGVGDAERLLAGLYAVLPGAIVLDLVTRAVAKGRPAPYVVDHPYGQDPALSGEEPPGRSGQEPPGRSGQEPPGRSGQEPPGQSGQDPSHPPPPPPRGDDVLLELVWGALLTLSSFGRVEIERFTVRRALLVMAQWILAPLPTLPNLNQFDGGAPSLIQEIFRGERVPAGFQWPPYDQEGMYWWRAVIQRHCLKVYALKNDADFDATRLVRFTHLFSLFGKNSDPRVPDYVKNNVKLALLNLKYWFDEPPADGNEGGEMTFWSENHQIQFAQAQYLAGQLFRNETFPRADPNNAVTGQSHMDRARPRLERWLDNRLRFGFSEWNAPGYYNEDLPALLNLVDFCADVTIKTKAAMVLDLLYFDLARFTCRGSFGVTAGRAYWEHKNYGWEQSVGETIEILFGSRGDFIGTEDAAVALATSSYDIPEVFLAIGQDRTVKDRTAPFIDRSRVSITFEEASTHGIGFGWEDDIVFWWGLAAYFSERTLKGTKRVVEAHDNLAKTDPFKLLYALSDEELKSFLAHLVAALADWWQARAGALATGAALALPFPLNLIVAKYTAEQTVEAIVNLAKDAWETIKAGVRTVLGWLGLYDDEQPEIPDTALQQLLESLLIEFNAGSVLSRANLYTYSNADAMLSSVQRHQPGSLSFQKHPWQASLGCEACVWTTARLSKPSGSSLVQGGLNFLSRIAELRVPRALAELAAPTAVGLFADEDPIGHDGPNYWTGSLALPMIVQHENAAIIAYNIQSLPRSISGQDTHAWFPRWMFNRTEKQDHLGGTWFFGAKDTIDPQSGKRAGSGYVALFSARNADWTNEEGNIWNDKEIMASGGSNIWVCLVGSEATFGSFDEFKRETLAARLHISGVGTWNDLQCSFDIPRAKAPDGVAPRLELHYDSGEGRFAGTSLELDEFPRFDNRYVRRATVRFRKGTSGILYPGGTNPAPVDWGSRRYDIQHAETGLYLHHDLDQGSRQHNKQAEQGVIDELPKRRLIDDALTTVRLPRRSGQTRGRRLRDQLFSNDRR